MDHVRDWGFTMSGGDTNWAAYVKKRVLVSAVATSLEATEVTVLELSPTFDWVKFLWSPEHASWVNAMDYRVVEELPPAVDPQSLRQGSNVVTAAWWKRDDNTFRRIILAHELAAFTEGGQRCIGTPVEQVMSEWDFRPAGILFGLNSDGVPLPDAVKAIGPKNRAEFEQQVAAWFTVHAEEAAK